MESLDKLEEMVNSFPPTFELLKKAIISQVNEAKQEFEDWRKRSVTWSVRDFAERARQTEGNIWKNIYNEDLFEEALIKMVKQHDTTIGINWETIDIYLDNCKR